MSHTGRQPTRNLIRIGDFSRLSSLSVRQLRRYGELGLLPPAQVDVLSRHRFYELEQAGRAELIALLRSVDLPLSIIQELLEATEAERRRVLSVHRGVLVERLAQAQRMLTTLDSILEEAKVLDPTPHCSFCGKAEADDRLVPSGSPIRICRECLDLCQAVLADDSLASDVARTADCVDRMTASAKGALAAALDEAERMGHAYVGTEHLLLALVVGDGRAARTLADRGVRESELRKQVETSVRTRDDGTVPSSWAGTEQACSICGKGAGDVSRLIAGPGAYICDECVVAQRRAIGADAG